jgi:hypothetical protein
MRVLSSLLLTTALLATTMSLPAYADEGRGHGGGDRHFAEGGGHWRDGDIHRFRDHDYDHWRGGNWQHGFHDGRGGWWWVVDGLWYFYAAPIYPYPDPYTPSVIITTPTPVTPFGAAPAYVYYCANPAGYYPYVPNCYVTWQRTVSAPAVMAPPVAPPPVAVSPSGDAREADDRQLNAYAVEFQNVNPGGRHARGELKALEKKVEAFRQTLFTRGYNAMDILKDAEGLEHRIAAAREKLPPVKAAPQP